jgi:putative FmdB family regulatory protein
MPNYDYKCNECGRKFQAKLSYQEIDDEVSVPCIKCGSIFTRRIFVATDFYFHGGYLQTRLKPHNIKIDPRSIK